MRVVAIGSVNVDHSFRVPSIPKPGETVLAEAGRTSVGGKSFNQAAAARLLGGDVDLVAILDLRTPSSRPRIPPGEAEEPVGGRCAVRHRHSVADGSAALPRT
ncbi:hypothetical protein EIY87_24680 [Amycolatopsis eburnea]|uniref:Carbohydrate kinase PfkB domain-containing protein n=1 Tax=Amycolatopsis eburnea TaxID=2267691 RepID=A0A3R9FL49_9PSEU|nr:hypothetical protein EIY87_24680 [Amycolatopsis eburnea]